MTVGLVGDILPLCRLDMPIFLGRNAFDVGHHGVDIRLHDEGCSNFLDSDCMHLFHGGYRLQGMALHADQR